MSIVKFDPWAGEGMFLQIGDIILNGDEYTLYTEMKDRQPWEFILRADDSSTEVSLIHNAQEPWLQLAFDDSCAEVTKILTKDVAKNVLIDLIKQVNSTGVNIERFSPVRVASSSYNIKTIAKEFTITKR